MGGDFAHGFAFDGFPDDGDTGAEGDEEEVPDVPDGEGVEERVVDVGLGEESHGGHAGAFSELERLARWAASMMTRRLSMPATAE